MNTPMELTDIREGALSLTEFQRATLASALLGSLPALLVEEDDGLAEAQRRSKELDENPSIGMSWAEIKQELGR